MLESRRGRILTAALCSVLAVCLATSNVVQAGAYLNEFHYDNAGADAGEFVEVVLDGGTLAANVTVSLYNGNGGGTYNTLALGTFTAHGELETGRFYYSLTLPANGIQNGAPDGIAVDISGTVSEFWSYEGVILATGGPAIGMTSTDVGASEPTTALLGSSIQRNGISGLVWTFTDGINTQGAVNFGGVATGACCEASGNCTVITSAACTTLGGTYQGDSTTCTPNPCPQPTGACCLKNGTCQDATTVVDCIIAGGWYQGDTTTCATTNCLGACCLYNDPCETISQISCEGSGGFYDGNGTNCGTTVCPTLAPVIISEYYESAGNPTGSLKAIELFNTSAAPISLDGHVLATWFNLNFDLANPNSTYDLSGKTIPANGTLVFLNNETDAIPGYDVPGAILAGTAFAAGGVVNFNGDDAIGIMFGPDIVDMFGVPGDQDAGPRGANPTMDAAWERDCLVTVGTADFDGCNFDALKGCALLVCPPGTPVVLACADGLNAGEWVFEGLNPSGDSTHHTLGSHACPAPTGACCEPNFTCTVTTQADCDTNFPAGSYQGDGTDCVTPCPTLPTGACCGELGGCSELTEFDCLNQIGGGIYRGDGTSCATAGICTIFGNVQINEIRIDHPGVDDSEYAELVGTPGLSLNGLSYIVIGDSPGTPNDNFGILETIISLDGYSIPADGHFLIANSLTFDIRPGEPLPSIDLDVSTGFENSDNVTHMLVGGLTGTLGQDLDTDDAAGCGLEITPWVTVMDEISLLETLDGIDCTYSFNTLGPDGAFVPSHAYRFPDGLFGSWTIGEYDPVNGTDTAGITNAQLTGACCNGPTCSQAFYGACDTPAEGFYRGTNVPCTPNPCVLPCGDIQNDVTPPAPVGSEVQVCSVIITNVIDSISSATTKGIHAQDFSGPAGAERGVTLVGGTADVDAILAGAALGDSVDIEGVTSDFNGLRQLSNSATFSLRLVANNGPAVLPTPVLITCADLATGSLTAEAYESVLVKLDCVAFTDGDGVAAFAGSMNYTVTDGTNSCTVRIPTTAINGVGTLIPTDAVSVTAILSQYDSSTPYDGGYQLLLMDIVADIGAASCAPAEVAACCVPSGACQMVTPAMCSIMIGTFNSGLNCGQVTCVPIGTGACCMPGDICVDAQDPADCCIAGGIYRGDGTACATLIPGCTGMVDIAAIKLIPPPDTAPYAPVFTKELIVSSIVDTANSGKMIQVQDNSGAGGDIRGVSIYGSDLLMDALLATPIAPGDRIVLNGEAQNFRQLIELVNFTLVQKCDPPVAAPTPTTIATTDLINGSLTGEDLESRLVTLPCVTFVAPPATFAYGNLSVTDGVNTVAVRVPASTSPLVGTPVPTGEVDLTGIFGQYNFSGIPPTNGYQLLLLTPADITPCASTLGSCCLTGAAVARGAGCACPGDMTGDLVVNMTDVAPFVDALMGNIFNPCSDVNGDTFTDGRDIQEFVAHVVDETTCVACIETTAADCTAQGGTFNAGGVCTPFPCGPTGACCAASLATCTDGLTYEQCIAGDPTATWYLDGTCAADCTVAARSVSNGLQITDVCHWEITATATPGTGCVAAGTLFAGPGNNICIPCVVDCPQGGGEELFFLSDGVPLPCYFYATPVDVFAPNDGLCDPFCSGLSVDEALVPQSVRVMTWNLLNYSGPYARDADFRTILNQTLPDIMIAQEVSGAAGANNFLNNVLNGPGGPGGYTMATFTDTSDTDNAMYYRSSVTYGGAHTTINTWPRDTDRWMVTLNGTSLYVYSTHLKASTGASNENDRNVAAGLIRANIAALGAAHYILGGDFNVYTSAEPAYVTLTAAGAGQLNDPIATPGNWHNSGTYAAVHTQSPFLNNPGAPGGAAAGGIDDRFDFLLVSGNLLDAIGLDYDTGTYDSFGNDGLHFNKDVNDSPTNLYGAATADSLLGASDHLPVIMDLQLP